MSRHPFHIFHAFSGGLDSLHAVYDSLKKFPEYRHHLVYINFYREHDRTEQLIAKTQYRTLRELFPDLTFDFSVVEPSRPSFYQMCNGNGCGRQPLLQQGITVVTMTNVMGAAEQHFGRFVACTVGWNKGDTFEENGSFLEWSLKDYERLREMYDSLIYFQDLGRQPRLMTPSWDKSKLEMWRALPESLRRLAYCGVPPYAQKTAEIHEDKVVCTIKLRGAKLKEYSAQGFNPTEVYKIECRPHPLEEGREIDMAAALKEIKESLLRDNDLVADKFQMSLGLIECVPFNPEPVPEQN